MGDFNQILSKEDKFSFKQGSIIGADFFSRFQWNYNYVNWQPLVKDSHG